MPDAEHRSIRGEIVGGLVSAGVAIPLAMGFGMFAFVSFGDEYFASGALAGLMTALVVGVVSVLLGDKSPTLYAPRITTTFFLGILLYGLAHSDAPVVRSGGLPLTLAVIFSIIMLGGVFQLLFGLVRLGTLIKFTPHPVMAGFQNAAAILLLLVQLGNVLGFDRSMPFVEALQHVDQAKPLSVLIAILVFVSMRRSKSLLPSVPSPLAGLAVGTVVYYAMMVAGLSGHLGPVIGGAPSPELTPPMFPRFVELARHPGLGAIVPMIVGGALALALIGSIDALLCARMLAQPGEPRVDGDRLLGRLGAGNVLAACFGGITSGLNPGPTLVNRAFGGRTPFSVLVNAAAILMAIALLFPLIVYLPRVALSAVIMVIAVQNVDRWTLHTIRRVASGSTPYRRHLVFELAVVIVVAALSVIVNVVVAVFLGVVIAVLLFAVRMSRSIVRRSYRGSAIRSRKSRTIEQMMLLERTGGSVLIVELQGALFFGTAETLAGEIAAQMQQQTHQVILDLRRVTEIDSSGAEILRQIDADLTAKGATLALCVMQPSEPAAILADSGVLDAVTPDRVFGHVDRALEWAEERLLQSEAGDHAPDGETPLERASIFAGLTSEDVTAIKRHLRRAESEKGRIVFGEGEQGKELFIITRGTASAYLRQTSGADIRLATFAPGTVFGELALLDPGPRSASVIADDELVCYALSDESFLLLSREAPDAAIKLLANLSRELSRRLRQANRTIHQLEE
ncbi:MAG TPA: SulP family inorganic anion transporter [Casimicrobiaceae bacterium]|nr:SulP family inorganic anion transporter [Casimicrobiaceae bacterium]